MTSYFGCCPAFPTSRFTACCLSPVQLKMAAGKPQKEAGEPQNEGGEPKEDVGDTSGGAAGGAGKEKSATELCHKSSPHPSSPDILMAECCAEHSAESIK